MLWLGLWHLWHLRSRRYVVGFFLLTEVLEIRVNLHVLSFFTFYVCENKLQNQHCCLLPIWLWSCKIFRLDQKARSIKFIVFWLSNTFQNAFLNAYNLASVSSTLSSYFGWLVDRWPDDHTQSHHIVSKIGDVYSTTTEPQ